MLKGKMKNLLLLFSHKLTKNQIEDAKENLNITTFIYLPDKLRKIWSSIPLESEGLDNIFKEFISKNCTKGDYILIEGEYGMVYKMVNWSLNEGYIPIYSYSRREYIKEVLADNTVKNTHYFKHIYYKVYTP